MLYSYSLLLQLLLFTYLMTQHILMDGHNDIGHMVMTKCAVLEICLLLTTRKTGATGQHFTGKTDILYGSYPP